jgi:hypothetical protein
MTGNAKTGAAITKPIPTTAARCPRATTAIVNTNAPANAIDHEGVTQSDRTAFKGSGQTKDPPDQPNA